MFPTAIATSGGFVLGKHLRNWSVASRSLSVVRHVSASPSNLMRKYSMSSLSCSCPPLAGRTVQIGLVHSSRLTLVHDLLMLQTSYRRHTEDSMVAWFLSISVDLNKIPTVLMWLIHPHRSQPITLRDHFLLHNCFAEAPRLFPEVLHTEFLTSFVQGCTICHSPGGCHETLNQ